MTDVTVTPPQPGGEEGLPPLARPAVLIVDDEATVVELLTEYLEGPDVEVLGSTDPREGLQLLEHERPQVALVDLKMPEVDGLEFVRRGRLVSEDTVFLMMTGYASMESVVDALKSGIHDYLTKPFASRKSVQLIVRNALVHAQLQTNLRIQARMTEAVLDMGTYDLAPGEPVNLVSRLAEAVRQVTDAPVVAHGILEENRIQVQINPAIPLSDNAREQLVTRIGETFAEVAPEGSRPLDVIVPPREPPQRGDMPPAERLDSILSGGVYTLEGLHAVALAAHPKPAAFTELALRMTQALCNHATIMAQARQATLQGERRKIASIMWNLTDGIILVNQAGLPEYMNPRATAILGLSLGQRPSLVEFRESIGRTDERLPDLVANPGRLEEEPLVVRTNTPEGPQFFQVRTHELSIPGQPLNWMVVFGNVTSVKQESERIRQLNEQLEIRGRELTERNLDLERVNKELDDFAYIASHDLQEPFRHIEIFSQFLENDLGEEVNDETSYILNQIRQNTGIASQLLKDLRTLSRVARTRNPYRTTDISKVVAEVLQRFEYSISEQHATIRVDDLPVVVCDKMKLAELLHNLLSNALKYNDKEQPVVQLGARADGDGHVFFMKDNGIGIEPRYHEYIFHPCRRIPFRNAVAGTGLGLTISRKIVEEHGGRLWLESEVGEGTTFFFSLPRREELREPTEDDGDTFADTANDPG